MSRERLLRGPRAHSILLTLDDGSLDGEIVCHAVEGADCRMLCPEGCESWDLIEHEHPLVDGGRCLMAEWLNNAEVIDTHQGSHSLAPTFIEPEFDGDCMTWRFSRG